MTITSSTPSQNVQRDRAVGAVLASAAGDALGAPHEFGQPLAVDVALDMAGGGHLGWAPGEWTDDTQTALAILQPLADGVAQDQLLGEVGDGLLAWMSSRPRDVGGQTRAALSEALRSGNPLTEVTAAWQGSHPKSAGNGSLMRTGPLGLLDLPRDDLAKLAGSMSALTHAADDAVEACILWTDAIHRSIHAPTTAPSGQDWFDLVADGITLLPADHRELWRGRLDACVTSTPEVFRPNGWVVSGLQAALSSLIHTDVPTEQPCRHLRLSIERAVRIGDDTDTVAAITGSLAGARWGATAVPLEWRRGLHGRKTYAEPSLLGAELEALARLAADNGQNDPIGWPGIDSLIPYYQSRFPSAPLVVEVDDGLTVGNVHALADQLPQTDVVVSLCRMGRSDVPDHLEHHVVGLIDTHRGDNPNLEFVLTDTADLVADRVAAGKRVFVHCVMAQNRTPTIAAAYLVRSFGLDPGEALQRSTQLIGSHPQAFLAQGVLNLSPREARN
jgi:ADP-ribosylglycohydrolase